MPSPNKIDFNGQTLIDLTSDTVTPETLANGVTAHNASGVVITGAMTPGTGDLSQIIAENFDETKDYEIGDYVIYSNCLYCFSASHTAGEWDDTEVTPVTVVDVLNNKVSKSGDTMTGNLTYQANYIDATAADNGVTSTVYPTTYNILDKNGLIISRKEGVISSDGTIASYWYTRNYDSNGTQKGQKGIRMTMDKSGNLTWGVDDSANFRSAIGAVNKAGDTMTGDLLFSNSGTATRQVRFTGGDNDYGRIATGATGSNAAWLEISTADDGNEPIYVRQYTGVYSTVKRTLTLLDANGNSTFPGTINTTQPIVTKTGNGVSYIDGTGGAQAGIYVKKGALNADQWIPGITIQTKSGGGWAIGNYNNENLQFVYGTKANIDAHNNSTVIFNLDTSGNFSGNASNVTGTVAVGHGGTGATTAANARSNLGITGIAVRPDYGISTSDLTAGSSNLTTNQLYFVYS